MNTCQMSDSSNRSAPSSPAGTVAAQSKDQQAAVDTQQHKLSRSRSLSDISQGDSPGEAQPQQLQAEVKEVAQDSLKVKIKTHNINTNNTNAAIAQEGSNNITKTTTIDGLTKPNNNKVGKSKANKSINGGSNNITSDKAVNPSTRSDSDTNKVGEPAGLNPNMNSHGSANSNAANGNSMSQVQPSSQQPSTNTQQQILPQTQNPLSIEPTPPSQAQSQQQPLLPAQPHKAAPTQSIPQPQTPAQQTPRSDSKKSTNSPATSNESKPKTTRARKSTAQSNKGANASNTTPTPPKPESKRTKKAKQNAESLQTTKSEPASSQSMPSSISTPLFPPTTPTNDNTANTSQAPPVPSTKKRKPRATAANSTPAALKPTESAPPAASPPKRTRKKKGEQAPTTTTDSNNNPPPMATTNMNMTPLNVTHPQLLSVASNVPMGSNPMMSNAPLPHMQQPNINRQIPGISPLDVHDPTNRYYSLTISPYANYDYSNAASLTRPSLSRLFTSSASAEVSHSTNSHSEEISRAFEDLRDNTWSNLSKCILEQAQQFDIPSLIGTLYALRSENDKLTNKVRDLTNKRDQLIAMNARLDLPGPMLTQHLNHTSPNFSSVVAGLTNSPKSLPNSSPSPAMNKSPIVPGGPHYPHGPPINTLGPPGFIDRSSPLIGLQTPHSGVNSLKSSTISTPSPPTGALMAHGANRASLMTVNNPPYMSTVHPSLSALNQLGGPNPPSSSYYPRQ